MEMAREMEETDAIIYCNWKNLTMVNHFLRPKVLGVSLIGRTDLEEVDVFMHHPAVIFGSGPEWKHKFFFTNRRWDRPRAHEAGPKARGGYWISTGQPEIIKENDGTPIGSKQQRVFHKRMSIGNSQRTNWYWNEYVIFEEQSVKSNDDNKKEEDWILCELFKKNAAEPEDSEAFPAVNPTLGGDQLRESISLPSVELEQFERDHGSSPGSSAREEVNQTPSASDGGEGDAQSSAWSDDWMSERIQDCTSEDLDDFEAFVMELMDSPPDSESWGL